MDDAYLPSPAGTQLLVDVRGAQIVTSETETEEIFLPRHQELISHIAVDIGGSLAKVVYFSYAPKPAVVPAPPTPSLSSASQSEQPSFNFDTTNAKPNGFLGPSALNGSRNGSPEHTHEEDEHQRRRGSSAARQGDDGSTTGAEIPRRASSRLAGDAGADPAAGSSAGTGATASPARRRRGSATEKKDAEAQTEKAQGRTARSGTASGSLESHLKRRSSTSRLAKGGRLNFIKFETANVAACIRFIDTLITKSATSNKVPIEVMRQNVKIMATGGGAHKFFDRLRNELGVEVRREEEMECLVLGLGFAMEIPNEVFWYTDDLIQMVSHPVAPIPGQQQPAGSSLRPVAIPSANEEGSEPASQPLPRPSPNPPQYSLAFDPNPGPAQFPCLLVNIGSGVSIIKVDDYGKFERISGTSLGGGTLWGLLSLLTGANSFDEMLALADKGDNSSVDMLVGDIYGQDYEKIGLKSSTIASTFGKVWRKGEASHVSADDAEDKDAGDGRQAFRPQDIARSLLYAVSNNIGQIAYMNAEKHNLDRIYFGGCFIRGHAATISTLSYAIRFWSKGTKRALFLRHEGYLGSIGAWLKNLSDGLDTPKMPTQGLPLRRDPPPQQADER